MDYTRLSDANVITQKYMDSLLIEARYIDSVVADTNINFWGGYIFNAGHDTRFFPSWQLCRKGA